MKVDKLSGERPAVKRVRSRGERVRRFILEHVEKHSTDISKVAAAHFGISRQAVNKHVRRLVAEQALAEAGNTRNRAYKLCPLSETVKEYPIVLGLVEDVTWRNDIAPILGNVPENVREIWQYGFTEMFNNAIDHSQGDRISVFIRKTAVSTEIMIGDNGIGIFRKIQTELGLLDERHAVLELSKGKLTTDPARHTGEGIFFSSRMFDSFWILSGGVFLSHDFGEPEDWILEASTNRGGTWVQMKLNNHTARTTKKIFDQYTSDEDYGFNKTVVPVKLAQYGEDRLVSRSQAKRLLSRVELFKIVLFDFRGVDAIGQAFADEVFRVFAEQHPGIELRAINANSAVKRMIMRATARDRQDESGGEG